MLKKSILPMLLVSLMGSTAALGAQSIVSDEIGSCHPASTDGFGNPIPQPYTAMNYRLDLKRVSTVGGDRLQARLSRGGMDVAQLSFPPRHEVVGGVHVWTKQFGYSDGQFSSSDGASITLTRPPRTPLDNLDPGMTIQIGEQVDTYNAAVVFENEQGQQELIQLQCQLVREQLARVRQQDRHIILGGEQVDDERTPPRQIQPLLGNGNVSPQSRQNGGQSSLFN